MQIVPLDPRSFLLHSDAKADVVVCPWIGHFGDDDMAPELLANATRITTTTEEGAKEIARMSLLKSTADGTELRWHGATVPYKIVSRLAPVFAPKLRMIIQGSPLGHLAVLAR